MMRKTRALTAIAAAVTMAAVTGCSTKSGSSSSSSAGSSTAATGATGTVKTGQGITGKEITLGVLTDESGVFAALGKDVTDAEQLYWDQKNAKGGVCGKYTVKLFVQDHGYKVDAAVGLYAGMKDKILAMQHTIGSPINTALADQFIADKIVNIPEAWAPNLTKNPDNLVPGATYDAEMIDGIDYLIKQGKLKDGDTVGHIHHDSEYGAGGFAGSKYMAEKHNLKMVEEKIKATDTDMTAQVTDLKDKGVKAIFLTTTPPQTASVASVAQSQGLDVPIFGNNPTFSGTLLNGPAAAALKANLYFAAPHETLDKATQLVDDFKAKYPGRTPSHGITDGYGSADIMNQILEKACASGDLTRDGVVAAKTALTKIETNGLIVTLDGSKTGVSPSKYIYIVRPSADTVGGEKAETGLYTSSDLDTYKPA